MIQKRGRILETSKIRRVDLEKFKNRIVTVYFKTNRCCASGIIIKMDEEKFFVCDSEELSCSHVAINGKSYGKSFKKSTHYNCLELFDPILIDEVKDIELCYEYHLSEEEDIKVILEDFEKHVPLLFYLYKGKDNIKTCQDCKNFDLVEFKCKIKNHFKPNKIACGDFK